jgi:hypothetical protein
MGRKYTRVGDDVVIEIEAPKELRTEIDRIAAQAGNVTRESLVVRMLWSAVSKPPSKSYWLPAMVALAVISLASPVMADTGSVTVVTAPSRVAGVTAYATDEGGQISIIGTPSMKTVTRLEKQYKTSQSSKANRNKWRILRTRVLPAVQFAAIILTTAFTVFR